MHCLPMWIKNILNFMKNDCNGTAIYKIETVTKKQEKMYTPHHTISHKHTHPNSRQQVKTDENSSPADRLWYTLRERPRQRHDSLSVEKKQAVERPRILPLPASTSRTL